MGWSELEPIFKDGAPIRSTVGQILGRGLFEADLIASGFEKRELKKLVKQGILKQVTTTWKHSWRTTYVLID